MSEPERPIEKALRASAGKRREQAPESWEMHPATRRLLRQEVAKRWPAKPATPSARLGWLFGHGWIRPVGVLGAMAAVVIVLWMSLPAPRREEPARLLAKNELRGNAPAESSQRVPPDSVAERRVLLKKADTAKQAEPASQPLADQPEQDQATAFYRKAEQAKDAHALDRRFQTPQLPQQPSLALDENVNGSVTPLATAPSAALPQPNAFGGVFQAATPAVARASTVPELETARPSGSVVLLGAQSAPAALPNNLEELSRQQSNPAGLIQYGLFTASQQPLAKVRTRQFNDSLKEALARATPAAQPAQSPKAILSSFRLEQSGQQLRIIDSDQSVYAGPIQNGLLPESARRDESSLAGAAATATSTAVPADSPANRQAAAQYIFHVVGTNRTINQKVSFSGTLDWTTNLAGTIAGKFDSAAAPTGKAPTTPPKPLLQNLRLSGEATIGQQQPIQILAVPAAEPPPGQ